MMWRHTVLELYAKPLSGEFPTEGDPADWIEEGTVLYCQGYDDTVIYFAPLWKIVRVKLGAYAYTVWAFLYNNIWAKTPWWKRQSAKFWAEMEENTISTEELSEMLDEEEL
jgi:hypothetical protein